VKSIWALQDAKNGFSRVVDCALKTGPQTVTRHGRECVVILSSKDYHRMVKKDGCLIDFFRKSPLTGVDLHLDRSKDLPREVSL
jgi:prevent-host-death family protein